MNNDNYTMTFRKLLEALNINQGDLIYIHSSFSRMKNYGLSPIDIIQELIDKVGEKGTVVFPSFSWNIDPTGRPWKGYEKYILSNILFDVRNTKSNIGYLSEVFRTFSGVIRSAHPFWSISALGPLDNLLVKNQEYINKPYSNISSFGMMKDNNVKIIGFGVTLNTTSLCPIVDFDLGADHTQKVFTDNQVKAKVINFSGKEIECASYTMLPEAVRFIKPVRVFEMSEDLKKKLVFLEMDNSYFFSYYFIDYYKAAIEIGREAIKLKQKMPWLDLLPIKGEN